MFYIKLDDSMNLVITAREPLFRGDNLNRKIVYLMPLTVGDIDMMTAYVYLNYIRADGIADVVVLERMEEMYNEDYYQYTFPVTCKLTKCPGEVCTWLNIFTGTPSAPTIAKSGECVLQVEDSKNMDDYLCDHQISAIYALQKQAEDTTDDVESMQTTIEKIVNEDETIYFSEDDSNQNENDKDAVIYFN